MLLRKVTVPSHKRRSHCCTPVQLLITCVKMFLYVFTVLLLLNAFTQDAIAEPPCADRVPAQVCKQMKDKGNCKNPAFEMIAKMQCAKTCEFCK
ncbi:hypothetical protein Aduo_003537 [Ancylostoma duodenale]